MSLKESALCKLDSLVIIEVSSDGCRERAALIQLPLLGEEHGPQDLTGKSVQCKQALSEF